ncbi:MAG: iron(III) transport system ATP-binding protein [Verrucomicrobiales bacterium]|jgi:iron(III) transport system ATP-binding protein
MVSITLKNVTKRFGDVVALDDLNLRIEKGELFFLLGPSGCGKTTLLRTIAGFYNPEAGHLFFDEDDVTYRPPHKRETAMVFQSYALWPHMNVAQNVAFGLQQKKLPRGIIGERVEKALKTVKMEAYASRSINQLSGGQQQRVALARALIVEPRTLLLDEPLSNLDAQLRLEMRAEIRRICKESGLTTVYVTHDQTEALSVADRIAVINDGEIAQVGTPTEIYRNPVSRFVASFIGETNFVPGRLIEPAKRPGFWTVETKIGMFEGRIGHKRWKPKYSDRVTLSVRPEGLVLGNKRLDRNCLEGKISNQTYLGDTARYELTVDGLGHVLQISEFNPIELKDSSAQTCFAIANPEDVVILQR